MHAVYVLSPDFGPQLYLSLRSLFSSGTTINRVTIFSVGGSISWEAGSLPITFREVESKSKSYWMVNKTYLCQVESEDVLFLDTDTIIQEPIGEMIEKKEGEVVARRSTARTLSSWDEQEWKKYLDENGVATEIPVLNAGFLIFRGGIHQGMGREWSKIMLDAWRRRLFGNGYHADQWSLPVVLGRREADCSLLGPKDHAFAWEGNDPDGATVYHTGAANFFRCVRDLGPPSFVNADLPIPRPNVTWHYVKDRITRKWKEFLGRKSKVVK
jgi:hypothetical protein